MQRIWRALTQSRLSILTALLFVPLMFGTRPLYAQSGVSIGFNGSGLSSLQYNGTQVLSYGDFQLYQVMFQNADGSTFYGATSNTVSVNPSGQTQTRTYGWGSIVTSYTVAGNRLNLTVSVTNQTSVAIQSIWFSPLGFQFPAAIQEYDGNTPLMQHTLGQPAVQSMSYGNGVMVLADDDVAKPMMLGFPWALNKPTNTVFPLLLNTGTLSMYPNSYPNINRPIAAQSTDQYHFSLRFGPSGSTTHTLASDVYQSFGSAFPATLSWPDRRPIGQLILATSGPGWATNPRGWLLDPSINVTTAAGIASLKSRILAWAQGSVNNLLSMNAQGMITWDIEGEQFPQNTSYVCDPRVFDQVAPEMAGIADEYFQVFKNAGLRVGVCIRPQSFTFATDLSSAAQTSVINPAQVAQLLIDKVNYARNRWGATLFYMDSNVISSSNPNPIDASILQTLQATFPDSLFIPEHAVTQYWAYSSPYKQVNQGWTSTPSDARLVYPQSFTNLYVPNAPLQANFNALAASVQQGDVLMFRGWFDDEPTNQTVKSLYQAAGTAVRVSVNPPTGTMSAGGTLQFGASVTGTANQSVSWTVTPAGQGTVSGTGLYTAPSATSQQVITVLATSAADPTKSGSATVTLLPAAAASISASGGSSQSATVGSSFGASLQATVKDTNGNPVSGATVTFSAPASGPSVAFGGSTTASSVTGANGVATAQTLTANSRAGSYTVTASVAGVSTSATFSLTNNAGAPAHINATGGTPQNSAAGTSFATALQATVTDASGNLINGAQVTFSAPAGGPSATFSGATSATVATSNGVATSPVPVANAQTGSYTATASVAGVATSASYTLTNGAGTAASVTASAGTPQSTQINKTFATALQVIVRDGGGNPISGATVTFTAPGSGAGANFSTGSTATAASTSGGVATAPVLTANGQAGSYTVTASVSGATSASFSLTNNSVASAATGGSIIGSGTSLATPVNLTAEGGGDWEHWGEASPTRKAGVGPQLSGYAVVGSGPAQFYFNDPRPISWTDGAPAAAGASNANGVFITGPGQGFSFTAPADTTARTVVVHVGGWYSGGTLTAHLSDGSAADFNDVTGAISGQYDRNYALTYHAGTAGATLAVSWTMTSGSSFGNVTLNAAALAGSPASVAGAGPASISASAGTLQSATVNTLFGTLLQAIVRDGNGNAVSGAAVTFSAPTSGPSGSFSGATSAAVATNASGVATAPAFTANGQAGSYTVSGVGTPASFSLTNNAAVVTGSLIGTGNSLATLANLTTEGTSDWVHWGGPNLNRKAGVNALLGNYTVVGSGSVQLYPDDPRPLSWTDGTPAAGSAGSADGVYISGVGQGFAITVPADTTTRTLTVHAGGWYSGGTLTAHLSDGSAADFTDVTPSVNRQYDENYTLTYRAAKAGQTLTVSWTMTSGIGYGNVTLSAAALR